ncbi:MAG: tryptophan--tRNA ligase, partial [Halobacteriovoraceae bacterium]|nr:tryptophan--tRNA ligase [Halobacteriovoraceae bacterium]
MGKKTILSGITPSGDLTIGNYIGAIANWKQLQKDYNSFYMIADLHALTVKQDPKKFRERTLGFLAQYLACGLDPRENTIFLQSHIPQHTELAWVFACITPLGQLNRMTQFKEKSEKRPNDINAGLYTYPVLMASDILLYQADLVPVGEDQRQHLELTRDIVQFFHNRYGRVFKEPDAYIPKRGAKIMSLQNPEQKMAKSDENPKGTLFVTDPLKVMQKKIKSAVTDSLTS